MSTAVSPAAEFQQFLAALTHNPDITAFDALLARLMAANPVFTGVGSRDTPEEIGLLMAAISMKLTSAGWTLRSGAADGADLAFESGVVGGEDRKQIFLPYPRFNGSKSKLHTLMPSCFEIAAEVHPGWERCSDFARKAHARNAFQVLGYNLMAPTSFVICWTKDGAINKETARNAGGTRTAIVLAANRDIPVINLARPEHQQLLRDWVGEDLLAKAKQVLQMKGPDKPKSGRSFPRKDNLAPSQAVNQPVAAGNGSAGTATTGQAGAPRKVGFRRFS